MKARPRTEAGNRDIVLTVAEAAEMLKLSENTVYSLVSQDLMPHVRFGKQIRIPRWGLLQYIAQASGTPLPADAGVAIQPTPSVHVQLTSEED